MQKPEGPSCQSCGMPLSRDQQGGGTEKDGKKTTEYCSHCYRGGAFTEPAMTAREMQARVKGKLQQMNLPAGMIEGLIKEIPGLRRWKG